MLPKIFRLVSSPGESGVPEDIPECTQEFPPPTIGSESRFALRVSARRHHSGAGARKAKEVGSMENLARAPVEAD